MERHNMNMAALQQHHMAAQQHQMAAMQVTLCSCQIAPCGDASINVLPLSLGPVPCLFTLSIYMNFDCSALLYLGG